MGDKLVKHTFRERWEIGIKQPYMVLSGQGYLTLVNANPTNIMFRPLTEITENHIVAASTNS